MPFGEIISQSLLSSFCCSSSSLFRQTHTKRRRRNFLQRGRRCSSFRFRVRLLWGTQLAHVLDYCEAIHCCKEAPVSGGIHCAIESPLHGFWAEYNCALAIRLKLIPNRKPKRNSHSANASRQIMETIVSCSFCIFFQWRWRDAVIHWRGYEKAIARDGAKGSCRSCMAPRHLRNASANGSADRHSTSRFSVPSRTWGL